MSFTIWMFPTLFAGNGSVSGMQAVDTNFR